jgi:hypothetical protein
MKYTDLDSLPREKLLELCKIYAKNWIAHDGCWFQSIEKKRGMSEAIEHDGNAWERFTQIEARRLKEFLGLPEYAGIDGLNQALRFRLQASLTDPEIIVDGNTLIYRARHCRVQDARKRKGMDYFGCKPVGIREYEWFAKAIDPRLETEAVSCPPDITDSGACCVWKFTLREE